MVPNRKRINGKFVKYENGKDELAEELGIYLLFFDRAG